jgi:hypothetical protein
MFKRVAVGPQLSFHVRVGGDLPVIVMGVVEWMRLRRRGIRCTVGTNALFGFKCPELFPDPDPEDVSFCRVLQDLALYLSNKVAGKPAPDPDPAKLSAEEAKLAKELVDLDDTVLVPERAVLHLALPEPREVDTAQALADLTRLARQHAKADATTVEAVNLAYGVVGENAVSTSHGPGAVITLNSIQFAQAVELGTLAAQSMRQTRFYIEVERRIELYRGELAVPLPTS